MQTKHGYYHHDAINRIKIRLKTRHTAIPTLKLVVEKAFEGAPMCDVASRIAEDMIAKLIDHSAGNVFERHRFFTMQQHSKVISESNSFFS